MDVAGADLDPWGADFPLMSIHPMEDPTPRRETSLLDHFSDFPLPISDVVGRLVALFLGHRQEMNRTEMNHFSGLLFAVCVFLYCTFYTIDGYSFLLDPFTFTKPRIFSATAIIHFEQPVVAFTNISTHATRLNFVVKSFFIYCSVK